MLLPTANVEAALLPYNTQRSGKLVFYATLIPLNLHFFFFVWIHM